jgi:hypothetical protein
VYPLNKLLHPLLHRLQLVVDQRQRQQRQAIVQQPRQLVVDQRQRQQRQAIVQQPRQLVVDQRQRQHHLTMMMIMIVIITVMTMMTVMTRTMTKEQTALSFLA